MKTHLGLFEGIGGFGLAAESCGLKTLAWCEWHPWAQKLLSFYFPEAEGFGDITKSDFSKYAGKIDLLTGGFPCQPFSAAGARKGTDDERYLWPAMLNVIKTVKPRFIIGENVQGLVSWSEGAVFDTVCDDIKSMDYEIFPVMIPAAAVGAPHKRERIWFVARHKDAGPVEYTEPPEKPQILPPLTAFERFPTQWPVCDSDTLDVELEGISFSAWRRESIKGYGNAICPQVAVQIIEALKQGGDFYEALKALPGWGNLRCEVKGWEMKKTKTGSQYLKLKTANGITVPNLATQVAGMLPTPRASEAVERRNMKTVIDKVENGGDVTLTTLARYGGMLPTPQAIDGTSEGRPLRLKKDMARDPEKPGSWRGDLKDFAFTGMLPTPAAAEGTKISGGENQDSLTKRARNMTGRPNALNPAFVAEMMGFPTDWTLWPFIDMLK